MKVHCAAGLRGPVQELATRFEERTGTRVELSFGGSGTLLASLRAGAPGDLYIAGDAGFVERAQEADLVRESLELASMRPVLGVTLGNPQGLSSLADLEKRDLRVGLGNPEAAAIGRVSRNVLQGADLWESVREGLAVQKPTVNELASDLDLGALDVAIVWDATLAPYPNLEAIRVDELEQHLQRVTVGVLEACAQPARALAFARFLASVDAGAASFESNGFTPTRGDAFEERPQLSLMSGAMLRPAVQETLRAFSEREGVDIDCVYNGCGILVAQMRTDSLPDAYFACDSSFLDLVQEEFEAGVDVARNPLVLVVQAGNPKGLRGLADLTQTNLRVGLGQPTKSALGALTHRLLAATGRLEPLIASGNLDVESPTGDWLVNQMRAGALDAAIVYTSNAALAGDELERIALNDAVAVQPFAILKSTPHRRTLGRLQRALESESSRMRFEELGFEWLGTNAP